MTHANGTSYILSSVYVAYTNCIFPFNIFLSLSSTIFEFYVTVIHLLKRRLISIIIAFLINSIFIKDQVPFGRIYIYIWSPYDFFLEITAFLSLPGSCQCSGRSWANLFPARVQSACDCGIHQLLILTAMAVDVNNSSLCI